ncbi:uncharacterized protein LOC143803929 [Ranitomeya variabilis]|uniref:uncharacterized protein LOC143803929 n=1 Tax=Ranitomeya variabilis TaxID=490064 RepID=UPI004057223C
MNYCWNNHQCQQLRNILQKAVDSSIISKKQMEYLTIEYPTIATFYALPKVHKNVVCPPGRPIVAGNNGFSEPICKLIDFVLHPLVETLPSYLKDTNDVLRKMDGIQLEDNMVLVTCDIESLYTSIKHEDGLMAVEQFLTMSDQDVDDLGFIHTDVFRKPTSTNSLLHFSSSHQSSLIRGIPVGQFLRMRRICSDEESFEKQSRDLSRRFTERGYSSQAIERGYWRAKHTDRSRALNKQRSTTQDLDKGGTHLSLCFFAGHMGAQTSYVICWEECTVLRFRLERIPILQ